MMSKDTQVWFGEGAQVRASRDTGRKVEGVYYLLKHLNQTHKEDQDRV